MAGRSRVRSSGTSRPAENMPGVPESTSAPAPPLEAASIASLSAVISAGESALAGGRFRLSSLIGPWLVVTTIEIEIISTIQQLERSRYSLAKCFRRRQQAYYQVPVAGEVIEVAGMNQHRSSMEDVNCQFLVRQSHRHAQNCVPSAFNLETCACFLLRQLTVKRGKICPHPFEQQWLNVFSFAEQD